VANGIFKFTVAGEAKPDWWIVTQVAQRMGFADAFPYTQPAQIFREHARLSGFENSGAENNVKRAFDISALAGIDDAQYDALQPVQWPVNSQNPEGTQRLFTDGRFYTPSGKARMIAVAAQLPAVATDIEFPLVLNTGRLRDQWHTMTRTGKVPRLNAHSYEPYVQMHVRDAQRFQLQDGGLARLNSRHGAMLARVQVSDEQRPGSVFVPMHWNDTFARSARVDALAAAITDPISGQPEFKHTPVHVEFYRPAWQGFVLSRERLALPEAGYCACTQGAGYWRHEIAGDVLPENWRDWVEAAMVSIVDSTADQSPPPCRGRAREGVEQWGNKVSTPSHTLPLIKQLAIRLDWQTTPAKSLVMQGGGVIAANGSSEWIEYRDAAMGRYRAACVQDGRLEAVFFIAPDQRLPEREWLASLFSQAVIDAADLAGLLAARPPKGVAANTGRTVCACFSIGEKTIANAIREQGLDSVEAVGACLKAGTGCGSCVPEIRRLIAQSA
jgi:assimilatory nitrate reductase catalytic subunit